MIKHIMAILIAVFSRGYKGKTVQFAQSSPYHRTTVAHFLNHGKWDSDKLERILQQTVIDLIYGESMRTGKPVLCLADDTIASRTKPSSRAEHPIEAARWHQSHLKKRQDYGHQAVSVTLSCNGISLNYAIVLYDKSRSKIQILLDIAEKLPEAPALSYFLCDSWYTSVKIMKAFLKKGFYTIGAVKSNRVIYPAGIKQQIGQFAPFLRKTDSNVRLVTVGNRKFYVYRYEGKLNEIENAVVLISYPEDAFGVPAALRAFISTDVSLTTMEILNLYVERWRIEVFFRQAKQKLALDKYQVRSAQGIRRFWLLMSLAHFICCTGTGSVLSFEDGYRFFQNAIIKERVEFIYRCAIAHVPLGDVLAVAV
ncbi:MAG: transposase [Abditibacteriota bacterium]|nr:transposase [Abditibacteriota bacterium]